MSMLATALRGAVAAGLAAVATVSAAATCPESLGRWNVGKATAVALGDDLVLIGHGPVLMLALIGGDASGAVSPEIDLGAEITDLGVEGESAAVVLADGHLVLVSITDREHPAVIGTIDLGSAGRGVVLAGDLAVATLDLGLAVVDVSSPDAPVLLAFDEATARCDHVALAGDTAFVACGPLGLRVLDLSDPSDPESLGVWGGSLLDLAVSGAYLYVLEHERVTVVDIADPATPAEVASLAADYFATWLAVSRDVLLMPGSSSDAFDVADVSDPADSRVVGSYYGPPYLVDGAIEGDLAVVLSAKQGAEVVDLSYPPRPLGLESIPVPSSIIDVVGSEDVAFTIHNGQHLRVVDLADPDSPVVLGGVEIPGERLSVTGSIVVVTSYYRGSVSLVDVADPATPVVAAELTTWGNPYAAVMVDDIVYVADGWLGLSILKRGDDGGLEMLGYEDTPGQAHDIVVGDGLAFIADRLDSGVSIIDVADPTAPSEVGWYATGGDASRLALAGNTLVVADGPGGLRLLDIGSPWNPREIATVTEAGRVSDVAVVGDQAYAVDSGAHTMAVVDITRPNDPRVMVTVELAGAKAVWASPEMVLVATKHGLEAFAPTVCTPGNTRAPRRPDGRVP